MGTITLTGYRGYQDIGTVGQTVAQLAGNVQSINQILDVGLRNTKDYIHGFVRVEDLIGLGLATLINGNQLTSSGAGGTTLTASDSVVITANNITLVNDSAAPGHSYFYGTNSSGVLGWYAQSGVGGYTASDSISLSGVNFTLVGDSASPGNSFFYGTNGSGTRGWYAQTYPAALTFSDSVSLSGTTVTLSGDSASPGDNFFYGTNSSGTRGWYASTPASIGLSFVESAGWNSSNGAIQLALTVAQDILIPYACTLTQVVVLTQGTPGSCTVAIQHCTSGLISNYPPSVDVTNGNSPVTAAGTQVISAATMASQTWVTSFLANDVIRLTLTANAAFTSVKIILRFQ